MRKRIIERLLQAHLRTFPPITKNGNNKFGDFKRTIIALCLNVIGGRNVEELAKEIVSEWEKQAA